MRVCIFIPAYLPLVGGAEIAVREITKRIGDFEFDLYTSRLVAELPRFENQGNVNITRIGVGKDIDKKMLALHGAFYAKERHLNSPYNLVWSIMASYGGFAALSFKKSRPEIPYLLTLQEGDSFEHILKRVWGFTWKYKQIFKEADALHSISAHLMDWGKSMGFKGKFAKIIPNGVNREIFNTDNKAKNRSEIRNKLGVGESDRVIISVSRLVEKNGLENLIDAFVGTPRAEHLIFVGEGNLRKRLELKARELGIKDKVHFVGTISQDEVVKFLHASDVFVRPSISEGFGNAFIEAMAAGTPVVATGVGGLKDFISDGDNALEVPPANPTALAKRISALFEDAALMRKISDGGSKTAERYSWRLIAAEMKEFLFSIKI